MPGIEHQTFPRLPYRLLRRRVHLGYGGLISAPRRLSALSLFLLCRALPGGFLRIGDYVDPLRIRCCLVLIVVVPVPPLVRRCLRITLLRILPSLLTAERRDIEAAPARPPRRVAAGGDAVGAEEL